MISSMNASWIPAYTTLGTVLCTNVAHPRFLFYVLLYNAGHANGGFEGAQFVNVDDFRQNDHHGHSTLLDQ